MENRHCAIFGPVLTVVVVRLHAHDHPFCDDIMGTNDGVSSSVPASHTITIALIWIKTCQLPNLPPTFLRSLKTSKRASDIPSIRIWYNLRPQTCSSHHDSLPLPNRYVFDVFGTLFDWRSAVVREFKCLARDASKRGSNTEAMLSGVNWMEFTDEWRKGYGRNTKALAAKPTPSDSFPKLDVVHRQILDDLIISHGLHGVFTELELTHVNLAWHRLDPWPDVPQGLRMLQRGYMTSTLSNASVRLLVDLARWGGISFDLLISSELFGTYKPNPRVYLNAAELLDLRPEEVCLVAAHRYDLEAAKGCGYATVYLRRKGEDDGEPEINTPNEKIDVVVDDLQDLAVLLGCMNI
ncbi:HAD-like domain-containing protein [Jimgerdemannia flammicorona]|uniref:HAD-like domain-containing protein n=2 Tax=Jimgerdemannia flammicorona TaxID=994334 RepID=A0A433QU72_9FUNG|nr:HAD-like domain-containing protein [Jimgerdemannia flammicorona]RUS33339.1 HAD-like domain-containing protein [Jimgerdemannia flammicorona]